MFRYIMLLMASAIVVGCTTSSNNEMARDTKIIIKYTNDQGENLLNPDYDNPITEKNTDLYYLIDGQEKKIFEPNLDYPKMFNIANDLDPTGEYKMRLFPNIQNNKSTAITHIKFENYPTDTLKVQYKNTESVIAVGKVWYNGELKWDVDQGVARSIVVTKSVANN